MEINVNQNVYSNAWTLHLKLTSKTKYVLVSLTTLGHLRIEDDRGMGIVYGSEVKSVHFLNGARHSLYYKRTGDDAMLLVLLTCLILH